MNDRNKSLNNFVFHQPLRESDSGNGLNFNGMFITEEILFQILSYVPPKQLLFVSLVCKKWCNIIKSERLWREIYNREHLHQAKRLPWYVYYLYYNTDNFKNLLKNGNGKERFTHWRIIDHGYGKGFRIENPAEDLADFTDDVSCFTTTSKRCHKEQEIRLENKKLLRYVIAKYKPHIYISEWIYGWFQLGNHYTLTVEGFTNDDLFGDSFEKELSNLDYEVSDSWTKVEMTVKDYPDDLSRIIFRHYATNHDIDDDDYIFAKMTGGVVRFDFESIIPLEEKDPNSTNQNKKQKK